jgi:hypothetical protein
MTITHDQEQKNKTYWDKERLEKFWGKNPTQEFNDRYEDFNDIQNELNAMIPIEHSMDSSPKKIRRFPSGAVRSDDRGRVRPDYVSPYAIHEIALHFTVAENDFGATNYYKGIKPEDILPSMGRHYLEFQEAVMKGDKVAMRSALRSMGANCVMGLHQIVLEEKGEYKEVYGKTEYVDIDYAKAQR